MAKIELNNVEQALKDFEYAVETDFKQGIIQAGKGGRLDKTFSVDIETDKLGYTVNFIVEDYYKFIERGRKPGSKQPPPKAILQWIKRKRIVPRSVNGVKPTIKQLTYLIGRSIAKKGIRPLPILSRAIGENIQLLDEAIGDALINDIDEKLTEMFDNFSK